MKLERLEYSALRIIYFYGNLERKTHLLCIQVVKIKCFRNIDN